MHKSRKAQVWVSVVIYTLIGITAIGLLLAAFQPRIKELRDSTTIKQTVEALHTFDTALRSTLIAPGNKRQIAFKLSEGQLLISPELNTITWEMKSEKKYSEPNITIREGPILVLTEQGNPWKVTLTLNYSGIANITFDGLGNDKILPRASNPYSLSVSNLGKAPSHLLQQVDISLRK